MALTDLERRILAHLPHWHPDEAWLIAEEGGVEKSIRAYALAPFGQRLRQDPFVVARDVSGAVRQPLDPEIEAFLHRLADAGYAEQDEFERWRMTEAGQALLTAEPEAQVEEMPGPVTLELSPAYSETGAAAEATP